MSRDPVPVDQSEPIDLWLDMGSDTGLVRGRLEENPIMGGKFSKEGKGRPLRRIINKTTQQ